MRELIRKYLEHLRVEKNYSKYTIKAYQRNLDDFYLFLKESKIISVETIDKYTIRNYLSAMYENNKAKTTIAQHIAAIRSFFKYLSREKIVLANPASDTTTRTA